MAAPCINDTCSITTSIDSVTRRLQIDARLDPTGGLQCIDGRGLGLEIYGAPAAAAPIDVGFQQLGISTAGEVWSIPGRSRIKAFSGGPENIPQGAGESGEGSSSASPIGTVSITNPYSTQAQMIVIGRFEVNYTISLSANGHIHGNPTIDGGAMIPFNGDIRTELEIDGSSPLASAYHDIGGVVPSALNNSNKRSWKYFAVQTTIGANATRTLRAFASHEGNNESVNIITINPASTPVFAQRGFMISGHAIILPFNGASL